MVSPGGEIHSGAKAVSVMIIPNEYDLDGGHPLPIGPGGLGFLSCRPKDQALPAGQIHRELTCSRPGQRMRPPRDQFEHGFRSLQVGEAGSKLPRAVRSERLCGLTGVDT